MAEKEIQTKSVEYLINQLRVKQDNNAVPSYALLIGAGCSYDSGIPLGGQVMELLKREIFRQDEIPDYLKQLNVRDKYEDYEKNFEAILKEKELTKKFETFENRHKSAIIKEVDAFTKEQLQYILPHNKRSKNQDPKKRGEENEKAFEALKKKVQDDYAYGYWFKQYSNDEKDRQRFLEGLIADRQPRSMATPVWLT